MTARACRNCMWWSDGQCRGAPPSVVVDIGGVDETRWPATSADDWCGAFRMAERLAGGISDAEFAAAHAAMAERLAGLK